MEEFSIDYIFLSFQRALLNEVTPELRAVKVYIVNEDRLLYVQFYYERKVSDEMFYSWESVAAEASADLGPDYKVDNRIQRIDYPYAVPDFGYFVYLRKEKNNQIYNKAILKHKDSEILIRKYLGKGKTMNKTELGKPGYKEIVNFEEFIGYAIHRETFKQMNTNWGVIHYLRGGVHVIPAYQGTIKELTQYPLAYALLGMQNALLGSVTPELRAVIIDFVEEDSLLYIRFYYDKKVSDDLIELWESAISETWADLGPECFLDAKIEQLDYPNIIPFRGRYAYLRKEKR